MPSYWWYPSSWWSMGTWQHRVSMNTMHSLKIKHRMTLHQWSELSTPYYWTRERKLRIDLLLTSCFWWLQRCTHSYSPSWCTSSTVTTAIQSWSPLTLARLLVSSMRFSPTRLGWSQSYSSSGQRLESTKMNRVSHSHPPSSIRCRAW